jgi:hypothetical protein
MALCISGGCAFGAVSVACTTDDTPSPDISEAGADAERADAVANDAVPERASVAACENVAGKFLGRFQTTGRNEPCTGDPECTLFEPRLDCSSGMSISACPFATSTAALPMLANMIEQARAELCPLNCPYSGGPDCLGIVPRCLDGGCTSVDVDR